jgi:hypothetical protein
MHRVTGSAAAPAAKRKNLLRANFMVIQTIASEMRFDSQNMCNPFDTRFFHTTPNVTWA